MEEYQGFGLADEVLAHMEALIMAEQREHQKKTGQRATLARKRPASKKKSPDA